MNKRELAQVLRALLDALMATDPPPKPKPKLAPARTPEGNPVMRYHMDTGQLEVTDGHGGWQEATWQRQGWTFDGGLWIDPAQTQVIDQSLSGRYTQERMNPPRDLPSLPR